MSINLGIDLFVGFNHREIESGELESLILDAVEREFPGSEVEEIIYTDDGVEIVTDNETICIDIDWEEIIIT